MSTLRCWNESEEGRCGGDVRAVEPLELESEYKCEKCGKEYSRKVVEQEETDLKDRLEKCYTTDAVGLKAVLDSAGRSREER